MKKKIILLLTLVLVLGFSIQISAANQVELRIVSMFGGEDPAAPVFTELINKFEEKHNVKIINDSAQGDNDFKTMVRNDFEVGNEPDITMYFTGGLGESIIESGKVVALNDILADNPSWKNNFVPAALEQIRSEDGNIYALPVTGFYEGLIVNTDLFNKYGLPLPTDWDKFIKAIKVFKENGVVPLSAGLGDGPHYLIEHAILKTGGAKSHDAGLKNGIDSGWIKGLNLIENLYNMGAFQENAVMHGFSKSQELFRQKEAAMIVEGSWFLGSLPEHDTVKVLPMPKVKNSNGNSSDLIGGFTSGYYLSKKAYNNDQKREVAIELMKYLTSSNVIRKIAAANGGVPAVKNATPSGISSDKKSGLELMPKADHVSLPIDAQISADAFQEIVKGISYISAGIRTPKKVLKKAREIEVSK